MRLIVPATLALVGVASIAWSQTTPRVEFGPVLRVDEVFVEGGASGPTSTIGIAFGTTTRFGIGGELTWSANPFERSYESWFISYAQDPNATREEIERMAPVAQRTLGYDPGVGGAVAFLIRGAISPRVSVAGRAGFSARRYVETSSYTILSIPAGVDPARVATDFQSSSQTRVRGGLLLGLEVPVHITDRVTVSPELRFVYGGPARIGSKHREVGFGVRTGWGF